MAQGLIAEDLVGALHRDPVIRSRVGGRVLEPDEIDRASLPNIVISYETDAAYDAKFKRVTVTCRAQTSAEADSVGAAVIHVISSRRSSPNSPRWITIQDRSGYDAHSKTFRRIIAVAPKTAASE